MATVTNIAAYRFAALTDLKSWRMQLLEQCRAGQLKGTILLSTEGINLFMAGADQPIAALLAALRARPGLEELEVKFSRSDHQPFTRLLVRVKKEIIAFGVEGIDPAQRTVPKLSPRELKQWLDESRPFTLLDTRNDYEVQLGTFRNARTLGLDHFRNFPAAVRQLPAALKSQPIVMFCTGGIRCEKAGAFMEREGFTQVHQLHGGILKYFEECGNAHYEGECFVFDHRVGLDPGLGETATAVCHNCRTPLSAVDQRSAHYVAGKSCPACWQPPAQVMQHSIAQRHQRLRAATTPLPGSLPYDSRRPLKVPAQCDGLSAAETFAKLLPHHPQDFWASEFRAGRICDDASGRVAPHTAVRAGQRLVHLLPGTLEPAVSNDIHILHEDEAIVVLCKPAPLPMHAGGRYHRNTLDYFLSAAYAPQKPRAAHRLDANTTGLVIVCRTRHFAALVQPQFERGEVAKHYLALVCGHPPQDAFHCTAPIGTATGPAGARTIDISEGLPATTEFTVLRRFPDGTALLEAQPLTGRTNQIRLHLQHLGWPVRGDPLYFANHTQAVDPAAPTLTLDDAPLCLHAWKICFYHPARKERVSFTAPRPPWAEDRLT